MAKYSSGLVSESFWIIEFNKVVTLVNEGKSWDEIKDLCIIENILGAPKEYRARRIYGYLKARIEQLDVELINIFVNSNISTQKIINLISIAKKNQLFFEFLYETYREKVMLGAEELTNADINMFFRNKQEQEEDINGWTDVTLKRLRSTYMNFLTDAGLLTEVENKKRITPPILSIELESYLKNTGQTQMLKAIRGLS